MTLATVVPFPLGSRGAHGRAAGSLGAAAERTAAPCGPRWGSSVAGSTKPGVAAILGMPAWLCAGGKARAFIGVVVAPGPSAGEAYASWIRLCFTVVPPEQAVEAARRLARLLAAPRT